MTMVVLGYSAVYNYSCSCELGQPPIKEQQCLGFQGLPTYVRVGPRCYLTHFRRCSENSLVRIADQENQGEEEGSQVNGGGGAGPSLQ